MTNAQQIEKFEREANLQEAYLSGSLMDRDWDAAQVECLEMLDLLSKIRLLSESEKGKK